MTKKKFKDITLLNSEDIQPSHHVSKTYEKYTKLDQYFYFFNYNHIIIITLLSKINLKGSTKGLQVKDTVLD